MSTALQVIRPSKTANEEQLEELEAVIAEADREYQQAESRAYEAWCVAARALLQIRSKPKLYQEAGFKTWGAYCASDRATYGQGAANRVIKALPYREQLPDIPAPMGAGWHERLVRPLTKLSSPAVAKTTAEQAIRHCQKHSSRLTARVIEEFVRKMLDTKKEQRAQQRIADEKLRQATPGKALKRLLTYTKKHLVTLQGMDVEFWTDAEAEVPGIAVRTAEALEELASFLRE